ncbi:hypothetical protein ACIRBX_01400 [Kitasatospora sp. NPDC096147]|uniref:hypothetical protein n=1 Tax=Kitasatospora sp. NPDC096147 TaxID=3364093 RepID=UPI00382C51B3
MTLLTVDGLGVRFGSAAAPPVVRDVSFSLDRGAVLPQGRGFLRTAWWIGVFPRAAITLTALAVNAVGRRAQRRFTGRSAA